MEAFTIVLIICSVLFLVVYYWYQYNKHQEEEEKLTWPREYNSCPDYWIPKGPGICENQFRIGRRGNNTCGTSLNGKVDFKTDLPTIKITPGIDVTDEEAVFQDLNSEEFLKAKCIWANNCGVTWEGISEKKCN